MGCMYFVCAKRDYGCPPIVLHAEDLHDMPKYVGKKPWYELDGVEMPSEGRIETNRRFKKVT